MTEFSNKNYYDLEERTAKFGEEIVKLAKKVPKNTVTIPILDQLIRAGTSMGANYCEANNASSKLDFRNKIYICKKEANETKYWLRILAQAFPESKEEIRKLWQEAQELNLIFQKIATSLKSRKTGV
jgi:four helix bundle protein